MLFKIYDTQYDTKEFISSFVDENTGEVIEDRKVLNKSIRLLWFRSVYPDARIEKEIILSGSTLECLDRLPENASSLPENMWEYVSKLLNRGVSCAIAKASIYKDTEAEKPLAVDYAVRYAEKGFTYNNEAALNAAADRAICSCGFICPEELIFQPETPNNSFAAPTKQEQAIADIAQLVDEAETPKQPTANIPPEQPEKTYDKATPVKDILQIMTQEQAEQYVFPTGKYKGKTVKCVWSDTKDANGHSGTLEWFATEYKGKDNILRAACTKVNK